MHQMGGPAQAIRPLELEMTPRVGSAIRQAQRTWGLLVPIFVSSHPRGLGGGKNGGAGVAWETEAPPQRAAAGVRWPGTEHDI